MKQLTLLALVLSPSLALAQWRADDGMSDGVWVMWAIGLGLAAVAVRNAYARSRAHGDGAVAILVVLAALLAVFPAARALLALAAAGFLVYGLVRAASM